MPIREIVWNVAKDMSSISPNTPQEGGVQGEHNVTLVAFAIPEGCPILDGNYKLYITCMDAAGGFDKTDPLQVENGRVAFLLPRQWTQYGGISTVTLVAEADGAIAYSLDGRVAFRSRQGAMKKERALLTGFMQEMCDVATDAAAAAATSAHEAQEAAETAEHMADSAEISSNLAYQKAAEADGYAKAAATEAVNAAKSASDAGGYAGYAANAANAAYDAKGVALDAQARVLEAEQNVEAMRSECAQKATEAKQYAEDAAADASTATDEALNAAESANAAASSAEAAAASEMYARSALNRLNAAVMEAEDHALNAAGSAQAAAESAAVGAAAKKTLDETVIPALATLAANAETVVVDLDMENGKASHTSIEIFDLVNNGNTVVADIGDYVYLSLAKCSEDKAEFKSEDGAGRTVFYQIGPDCGIEHTAFNGVRDDHPIFGDVEKLKADVVAQGNAVAGLFGSSVTGEGAVRLDDVSPYKHELGVKLTSKNLCPVNAISTDESISGLIVLPILTAGEYTFSADVTKYADDTAGATRCGINVEYTDGTVDVYRTEVVSAGVECDGVTRNKSGTFTVRGGKTVKQIKFWALDYGTTGGATRNAKAENIQVERGTTATAYTPHIADFSAVQASKNLLKMDGREVVDFGAGKNTTQRTFTGNGIIVGCTRNNYYYPANATMSELSSGVVSGFSATGGYGVGVDMRLLPNTQYSVSVSDRSGAIGLGQYDADGNWLQDSTLTPGTPFTTHENAAWGLIVFAASSNGTEFRVTNPQIELGATATAFMPYGEAYPMMLARYSKNLMDMSKYPVLKETKDGITFEQLEDGQIHVYGQKTVDGAVEKFVNLPTGVTPTHIPAGTYSAKRVYPPNATKAVDFMAKINGADGAFIANIYQPNTKLSTGGYQKGYSVYVHPELTDYIDIIVPTQFEVGSVVTEFEPCVCEEYTANADGTVSGVMSVSPTTTLVADVSGVIITADYGKDANAIVNKLADRIAALEAAMANT